MNCTLTLQCVKLTFFSGSQLAPKYFKMVTKVGGHYDTHTNNFYPVTVPDRLNCSYTYHVVKIFPQATKRTLQWVIYNVKGYLNPRSCLVTTIDLRSKPCMCCILEMGLTRNFAADLSLQIFNNH